ncbi:MAG: O-antigen ligase C-terminal domain-containing protein [Nitrosomonadales bacterium]|nr:O-antigen ligase C-terminal domain-containing protein [Nitrosomonadales bacterium]
MWVLPFLYPRHAYPLTTFYQEWGAAILGLLAALALLTPRFWRQPEIPQIALLPIGLLALALLQWGIGMQPYPGLALLLLQYFLWMALLMLLGKHLRTVLGFPLLATILATFLLLGTELSALAGVIQHFRWHTPLDGVITQRVSDAVYGNLAQPNHFANYLAMGLASLAFLLGTRRIPLWTVVLLTLPILFTMTLSGSRTSWLYLIGMAALFLWNARRDVTFKSAAYFCLALLPVYALMHGLVQLPWLSSQGKEVTTLGRLFGEVGSGSIRLYLWQEAWQIFLQFPWLGAGFGQFAWQHFLLGPTLHDTSISGLYNNAHDLPLQLAAESGLAGLGIVLFTLARWLLGLSRTRRTLPQLWACAVLLVLGIHSLLEYPLWYAYFLGIAAFLLGALDDSSHRLELSKLGRATLAVTLAFGLMTLTQLFQGYRTLESLLAMRPANADDVSYVQRQHEGFLELAKQPQMRPYAELYMSPMFPVSADFLDYKRGLNERIMHFIPAGQVVYRESMLLALADQQQAAQSQMECAIWSYPGEFAATRNELTELARKDPAHFAALLKFALQKFEEYQRAVPAR